MLYHVINLSAFYKVGYKYSTKQFLLYKRETNTEKRLESHMPAC